MLDAEKAKEMQVLMQLRYVNQYPDNTMRIYEVPKPSLIEFCLDKRRNRVENYPQPDYRVRDEEISGHQTEEEQPVDE